MAEIANKAYTALMTRLEYDTKISPEGRMVIPAEVRRALGLVAGDRIRLVLNEGEVHLVSARTMAASVWANNHGGDAGDSVADVRAFRQGDRALSDARLEAQSGSQSDAQSDRTREPDLRSEDQIADDLMSVLGLNA